MSKESMAMDITLYPEMNACITELLDMSLDPTCLYASAYIKSLESHVASLTAERSNDSADLDCNECPLMFEPNCNEICATKEGLLAYIENMYAQLSSDTTSEDESVNGNWEGV